MEWRIAFACDHAGVLLKRELIAHIRKKRHETLDMGTESLEVCYYPYFAKLVAESIRMGEVDLGILICESGIGMSIAANKFDGIRAAACSDPYSARLAREHTNSNILAMGALVVTADLAKMIADHFLEAQFEGEIHKRRLDLVSAIENREDMLLSCSS